MKKLTFLLIASLSMSTIFAQTKTITKTHKKKHHTTTTTAVKATPSLTATEPAPPMEAAVAAQPPMQDMKAQASEPAMGKAPVEFAEIKHSFGKIKQGIPASYTFTFKNASTSPIIIESATAGCGCTTPEYPKGPVAKGSSEKIKVTYNAASMGNFTKTVTVKVAKYSEPIILTIDGEVITAPAAETKDKSGK